MEQLTAEDCQNLFRDKAQGSNSFRQGYPWRKGVGF